MDFIKRMKKREFIEMTLKTIAAVFAFFVAVILMEGMIYGIEMRAVRNKTTEISINTQTVAYAIKQGDDEYVVLCYNEGATNKKYTDFSCKKDLTRTKAEVEAMNVTDIIWRAPTASEFSITWPHYVVIGVLAGGLIGFYAYRFIKLGKAYKKIEKEFETNGKIEISNL